MECTHDRRVGAADDVGAASAAAADAHDGDGRAGEANEAREVAEHDAQEASKEVRLRGGALQCHISEVRALSRPWNAQRPSSCSIERCQCCSYSGEPREEWRPQEGGVPAGRR